MIQNGDFKISLDAEIEWSFRQKQVFYNDI